MIFNFIVQWGSVVLLGLLIYGGALWSLLKACRALPGISIYWVCPVFLLIINLYVGLILPGQAKTQQAAIAAGEIHRTATFPDLLELRHYTKDARSICDNFCKNLLRTNTVDTVVVTFAGGETLSSISYTNGIGEQCGTAADANAECVVELTPGRTTNVQIVRDGNLNQLAELRSTLLDPQYSYGTAIRQQDDGGMELLAMQAEGRPRVAFAPVLAGFFQTGSEGRLRWNPYLLKKFLLKTDAERARLLTPDLTINAEARAKELERQRQRRQQLIDETFVRENS